MTLRAGAWPEANTAAGALWALAFVLFLAAHGHMLIGPRAEP